MREGFFYYKTSTTYNCCTTVSGTVTLFGYRHKQPHQLFKSR